MTDTLDDRLRRAYERHAPDYHISGQESLVIALAAEGLVIRDTNRLWDCNICGGQVDLTDAVRPTAHVGPGGNPRRAR